jgi:hypothetical protein
VIQGKCDPRTEHINSLSLPYIENENLLVETVGHLTIPARNTLLPPTRMPRYSVFISLLGLLSSTTCGSSVSHACR